MHQFLKTKKEIKNWLDTHGVHNYTLVENAQHGYLVDVEGHVFLKSKNLSAIPVQFNHVTGSFCCNDNQLTSLMGCPNTVGHSFNCQCNKLIDLIGGPHTVGIDFSCANNRLQNLDGCPTHIRGDFFCDHNHIKSLTDGPQTVESYHCNNNQLTSLMGCPLRVEGDFFCENNCLLGELQNITDFKEIYRIHQELVKIKHEKNALNDIIKEQVSSTPKHICKI